MCWASAAAVGGWTSAKAETGACGGRDACVTVIACLLETALRCCSHLHTRTDSWHSIPEVCSTGVLKRWRAVRTRALPKAETGADGGWDVCLCHCGCCLLPAASRSASLQPPARLRSQATEEPVLKSAEDLKRWVTVRTLASAYAETGACGGCLWLPS